MIYAAATLAPAFLATVWLATGGAHLAAWTSFNHTVAAHRLLPRAWVPPATALLASTELTLGLTAAVAVVRGTPLPAAAAGASVALAVMFLVYLIRLRARPGPIPGTSCGCSPLAGPVNRWSMLPAASVLLVASAGWSTAGADRAALAALLPAGAAILAVSWGLTLATLVLLLPAAAGADDVSREALA